MDRARLSRLALALVVLTAGGLLLRGYVTDDTYIHLRYARHLVERGELSFNPGEPTYGCTSPLWVFGLALLLRVGVAPLVAPWLLGGAAALLALLLFDALIARLPLGRTWRLALLLLLAADAWFLRWTWSGMETPLATALLLLLAWPAVARRRGDAGETPAPLPPRFWLGWGMAGGLAALTRPEFLLLALLAWPWLAWRGERPLALRAGLPALLGGALVYGPWLLYAWRTFGRLVPGTAAAKSYAATLAPAALGASLWRSAQQLGATQAPLWLALGLLALLALAARRGVAPGAPRAPWWRGLPTGQLALVGLAVTWTAALAGGYAVKRVWVISRYLSPLSPLLLIALALVARAVTSGLAGAAECAGRRGRARLPAALLLGGVLATLAVNAWLLTARVRPHAVALGHGVRDCLLPLGEWLHDNTPPEAVVACLDIGAIGWASDRQVLDLAGLVSPELLELGRRDGFPAMVASGAWLSVARPDFLIDRTDGPPRWPEATVDGTVFTPLRDCVVPGLGVTEPQAWTVTLYKLSQ